MSDAKLEAGGSEIEYRALKSLCTLFNPYSIPLPSHFNHRLPAVDCMAINMSTKPTPQIHEVPAQSRAIKLNEKATGILKMLANGQTKTPDQILEAFVNKALESQEKPLAKSRLNLHKKSVVQCINVGTYKSLEHAYNSLGLSREVAVIGGIETVYTELYFKSGNPLPENKIKTEVEAVNPA